MKERKLPLWARRTLIVVLSLAGLAGITYGILLFIGSRSSEVNVYSVPDVMLQYYDAGQAQTEGRVSADRIQSVYVSSTQLVTDIFVKEGDRVKAGDPLMSYDTTLTDLELKRQEITVKQLELEIKQAEANIALINTYKVGSPVQPSSGKVLFPDPTYDAWMPRAGIGTEQMPKVFIWSSDRTITPAFIDNPAQIGLRYGIVEKEPDPETGETPEPGYDTVYAVFEFREECSIDGYVYDNYMIVFTRNPDGTFNFCVTDPPAYDEMNPIDDTPVDTSVYVTWDELVTMKKEASDKLQSLQMDLKKAELQYSTLEYELKSGEVLSKIDGVVKTVADPEAVSGTEDPVLVVSGGGGYYVTGALSENELSSMNIGDTVSVMSWESYQSYDAEITEISEFPAGSNYYHYSEGNNNVSLYPFTAALGDDIKVREGEYASITYTPGGKEQQGIYIASMFVRTENGRSYVWAENSDGVLERREVLTGGTLWGSYTQILSGVSEDDWLAFPYGKTVKAGARAKESGIDMLYNY